MYKDSFRVGEADCWIIDHAGSRGSEMAANRLFWRYNCYVERLEMNIKTESGWMVSFPWVGCIKPCIRLLLKSVRLIVGWSIIMEAEDRRLRKLFVFGDGG